MFLSVLYVVLAAFGLGFLVFIHELGHYFMARRQGMTVEAFGIGFGKPILSWERKGVKWHLCWLPFGGYVRIAGMEKKGNLDPYDIPDGFYGKRPWQRIQVALMGPLVNILFAFIAFTLIWVTGGREKPFSEFTQLIGWVDPNSQLYACGVRPGDQILTYNQHPFKGFKDLVYTGVLNGKTTSVSGLEVDYMTLQKKPFDFTLENYEAASLVGKGMSTIGIEAPANFLIYQALPQGSDRPLLEGSPMENSGIEYNDRIIWVNGELVFSTLQLSQLVNEPRTLLTIERSGETFISSVPRIKVSDLRMSPFEKAEIDDWKHVAKLDEKTDQLYFIPYNLNADAEIENAVCYIDENSEECLFSSQGYRKDFEVPLLPGDRILAVDGIPIYSGVQFLESLQQKRVQIIVERQDALPKLSWENQDIAFTSSLEIENLKKMIAKIGTKDPIRHLGNLHLLSPVIPKPWSEFPLSPEKKAYLSQKNEEMRKEIEDIEDPKRKESALRIFQQSQNKLVLGIVLQDRQVIYNPSPFTLFFNVFEETWRTLSALITGYLSPKWMSGPVGIVQVIHHGWMTGIKEALFWMGVISLNLGILNLLPIPVLDGGHICFSLFEAITKKRIKFKTMERLIIPFIVLLVGIVIFVTYQDLSRLFSRFF